MSFKHILLIPAALLCFTVIASAQSTNIPLGTYAYPVLQRLEIKSGQLAPQFSTGIRPYTRKGAADFVWDLDSASKSEQTDSIRYMHPYWHGLNLSKVDQYNMGKILEDNPEWVPDSAGFVPGKHPLWNTFYTDKANLITVNKKDFFLVVNPLLDLQAGKESADNQFDYLTTRGAEIHGLIANKIGFYTSLTENQERPPYFVQNWINQWHAVPGIGYYKTLKNGEVDYINASGYISFGVTKYINVQFGYGNNFIGDGYRSLLLSDYSPNYLFLKLHTHIWKLDYTNIFAQLTSQSTNQGDYLRPQKYMTINDLSFNAVPWLSVGIMEAITYSRANHFEFAYLDPIIFNGFVQQALGSPDKDHIGFHAKAIVAHHFEFYGQFLIDEFKIKDFLSNNGWWGNKWAMQVGGKYVDAFSVKNLDLQAELNVIRPYTYTHDDSVSNYSNYNQPLADPFGANLVEVDGIINYQPVNRLYLNARIMVSQQGLDDSTSDWGGNIFINYNKRQQEYNNRILQGLHNNIVNFSLTASYELAHNLYVDLSYLKRKNWGGYPEYWNLPNENTGFFSLGLRWNMGRRDYDY
jgi:hypothetical protein